METSCFIRNLQIEQELLYGINNLVVVAFELGKIVYIEVDGEVNKDVFVDMNVSGC